MQPTNQTCTHCGKPLTNQICLACDGKGYARELALIKRECEVCGGTGRVWRCEDEYKHIVDDFKASHTGEPRVPAQPEKLLPIAHGSPEREINLWHPIHPENPWNLNALNNPLNTVTPHKIKHPGRRSSRKASHKK